MAIESVDPDVLEDFKFQVVLDVAVNVTVYTLPGVNTALRTPPVPVEVNVFESFTVTVPCVTHKAVKSVGATISLPSKSAGGTP